MTLRQDTAGLSPEPGASLVEWPSRIKPGQAMPRLAGTLRRMVDNGLQVRANIHFIIQVVAGAVVTGG